MIIELLMAAVDLFKWASGKIDDITYKKKKADREEKVEVAINGNREERLRKLEELGK
jgi:hypothetical protein